MGQPKMPRKFKKALMNSAFGFKDNDLNVIEMLSCKRHQKHSRIAFPKNSKRGKMVLKYIEWNDEGDSERA